MCGSRTPSGSTSRSKRAASGPRHASPRLRSDASDEFAELGERFGVPQLSAAEQAELDARYETLVADLERRAGGRDEPIGLDAETHRKLVSLSILARATLSETPGRRCLRAAGMG